MTPSRALLKSPKDQLGLKVFFGGTPRNVRTDPEPMLEGKKKSAIEDSQKKNIVKEIRSKEKLDSEFPNVELERHQSIKKVRFGSVIHHGDQTEEDAAALAANRIHNQTPPSDNLSALQDINNLEDGRELAMNREASDLHDVQLNILDSADLSYHAICLPIDKPRGSKESECVSLPPNSALSLASSPNDSSPKAPTDLAFIQDIDAPTHENDKILEPETQHEPTVEDQINSQGIHTGETRNMVDFFKNMVMEEEEKLDSENERNEGAQAVNDKNPDDPDLDNIEEVLKNLFLENKRKLEEKKKEKPKTKLKAAILVKAAKKVVRVPKKTDVKEKLRNMMEDHALLGVFVTNTLSSSRTARLTIYITTLMSTFMTSSTFYGTPIEEEDNPDMDVCESFECQMFQRFTDLTMVDLVMILINNVLTLPLAIVGVILFTTGFVERDDDEAQN
eukprot:TRINITY_DN792_c0_g1_i8.p1 TRINITY_DN792_c0_g1~~TRINITY_DN792_c0_g1_i8.p1  ORF type:complete len:448 (-),score=67.67 TRINITY_DN792_c0_g1_i8:368-1711(-)